MANSSRELRVGRIPKSETIHAPKPSACRRKRETWNGRLRSSQIIQKRAVTIDVLATCSDEGKANNLARAAPIWPCLSSASPQSLASISLISLAESSAAFKLRGICAYKYRPTNPLSVTAVIIQKAIPAIPPNLKEECKAITNGAAVPIVIWKSSQCRELPCRPSQLHFLRSG